MKNSNNVSTKVEIKPLSDFVLTRKLFNEEKSLYGYVLEEKTHIFGKEKTLTVNFSAKDIGGYELLDLMFSEYGFVYLVMHDETMTDSSGKKSTYRVYEAQIQDTDGVILSYKLKPYRESDKAILQTIIQKRKISIENIEVTPEGGEIV